MDGHILTCPDSSTLQSCCWKNPAAHRTTGSRDRQANGGICSGEEDTLPFTNQAEGKYVPIPSTPHTPFHGSKSAAV